MVQHRDHVTATMHAGWVIVMITDEKFISASLFILQLMSLMVYAIDWCLGCEGKGFMNGISAFMELDPMRLKPFYRFPESSLGSILMWGHSKKKWQSVRLEAGPYPTQKLPVPWSTVYLPELQ